MGDLIYLDRHVPTTDGAVETKPSAVEALIEELKKPAPAPAVDEELLKRIAREAAREALEFRTKSRPRRRRHYNPPPPDVSNVSEKIRQREREIARRKGML